jgi:hypothetical protein
MNENISTQTTDEKRPRRGMAGILRRILFCVACLVTLIALYYAEENWRGKRAWNKFKTEWEAKGEKFDLQSFVPPPVPDDQNFAMTPFLAPLFDFNPRPLQPGQSLQKDTNAVNRIMNFANDLGYPDSSAVWAKSQPTDLQAWAAGIQKKLNGKEAPVTAPATRAEAAREILSALQKYQPVLDEIQAASRRPYSRFNISYADEFPATILLPHLAVIKRMAQIYGLRASSELALGQNDAASADVNMTVYLSGTMKDEPFLISGLVRIAILQLTFPHIWEGLATHQWTDAQLLEFETELRKIDLLAEYEVTMRGERALGNGNLDFLSRHRGAHEAFGQDGSGTGFPGMPSGWWYQNQVIINRMHQEFLLPPVDAANHHVDAEKASMYGSALDQEFSGGFPPYKILAKMLLPALDKAINKYAFAQANLDLARVACALERYRIANGQYPDSLTALSPQFITTVPNDVISGEALKYRRTDDGNFLLYSVGWNGKDDRGNVAMTTGTTPHMDQMQGDWVWPPYPAK